MKLHVNILGGAIQEADQFQAVIRSRKDGLHRVEIVRESDVKKKHRDRAHVMMREITRHSGVPMETLKREACKAIGHGEHVPTVFRLDDGSFVKGAEFRRFSTEILDDERYEFEFIPALRSMADFLELNV